MLRLLLLTLLLAPVADAAPWDKSQRLKKMIDAYDATDMETIEGTVVKIYEITPKSSPSYGIHIILKADKEAVNIHVGPGWYLKNIDNILASGDKISVTGARTKEATSYEKISYRSIRAAEIRKDKALLLKLRDVNGRPLWSGF
jgi:hypothetical protein